MKFMFGSRPSSRPTSQSRSGDWWGGARRGGDDGGGAATLAQGQGRQEGAAEG